MTKFYSTAEIAKRNQRRTCVVYDVIKELGYPADKIEMRRGKPARCYSWETVQCIEDALHKLSRKPRKTEKRSSEQDEIKALNRKVQELAKRVAELEARPVEKPSRFWRIF